MTELLRLGAYVIPACGSSCGAAAVTVVSSSNRPAGKRARVLKTQIIKFSVVIRGDTRGGQSRWRPAGARSRWYKCAESMFRATCWADPLRASWYAGPSDKNDTLVHYEIHTSSFRFRLWRVKSYFSFYDGVNISFYSDNAFSTRNTRPNVSSVFLWVRNRFRLVLDREVIFLNVGKNTESWTKNGERQIVKSIFEI